MRHNSLVKNKVRELRQTGFSLNQILKKTSVPKTTIRTWISDILLTEKQLEVLRERAYRALQEGRIRTQKIKKDKRLQVEKNFLIEGKSEITDLASRELLIAGIALYWAEGFKNKHERRLGFCNSDPDMIRFYIKWLEKSLLVNKKDIIVRLTINESYKGKVNEIENYWSKITNIPLTQFTKPFYQKTQWRKRYSDNNYHGVLRIHVQNSLNYLLKMRGWIVGLKDSC